ncbi:WD40 repeat-like protein [Calocera cornea HHB12733]|uniref:WD40 repeat-like protein n=1 Tax=Calocera cornea HHB12733 TaxID=1353952 RepID=A0A165HK36_9BASI|nr:WD40 repeat-like protein [Calocera cornea HHB12733]
MPAVMTSHLAEGRPTCLLRLDWDSLIIGFADGSIARTTLKDLLREGVNGRLRTVGKARLHGNIVFLHVLHQALLQQSIVVAGSDDGGVGIWSLPDLSLLAKQVVFSTPLVGVHPVEDGHAGLRNGLICLSSDGTVAFVNASSNYTFTSLVPCASAPLTKACFSADNLVFMYENGKARLWDVKTLELWRIVEKEKAEELMEGGGWDIIDTGNERVEISPLPIGEGPPTPLSLDSGIPLILDVKNLDLACKPDPVQNGASPAQQPDSLSKELDSVLPLVAGSFTYALDSDVDGLCDEQAAVPQRSVSLSGHAGSISQDTEHAVWETSPTATTFLLLSLVTVLRLCLTYDVFELHAGAIVASCVASLPEKVPGYQPPALDVLVRFWYDPSVEIQQAARLLFGAVLSQMADNDVIVMAEFWQRQLPCLQPDADQGSPACARALLICGNIAAERYALLSTSTLRDISKSISLYLHDEHCKYSILAIDLCSRGFHIWQQYIDAVETLRCLFKEATSFERSTLPAVGLQSRLAILQIASANTALFMTTVSLDILNAPTADHLKAIMLIVAFIVRKKPLVLYLSLPRLVDAVVKSLDPDSSSRDAVLQAATVILDQLVKTYPSVAFNGKVQRLAVGTIEGAVIMYDLKTATRLYVLEAHRKRVSACTFSPDGRRLVSVSLEESVVVVWKVGTSFSSLFNPGGPPRQGHAGSEPYKTIPFNVGDEGHMTVAASLEWITFEWPGERSARLKIRDSTFTFNT